MGTTTYHMGHSVEGPLMRWNRTDWKRACKYITRDDGSRFTPDDLKMEFLKMLGQGIKTFPIGEKCDNWDNEKGCMGHPCEEQPHHCGQDAKEGK